MAWFSIKGETLSENSLDQFLALITARDSVHALRKSASIFKRKIIQVEEVEVRVGKIIRGRRSHAV